jgi:hypothetical protein
MDKGLTARWPLVFSLWRLGLRPLSQGQRSEKLSHGGLNSTIPEAAQRVQGFGEVAPNHRAALPARRCPAKSEASGLEFVRPIKFSVLPHRDPPPTAN